MNNLYWFPSFQKSRNISKGLSQVRLIKLSKNKRGEKKGMKSHRKWNLSNLYKHHFFPLQSSKPWTFILKIYIHVHNKQFYCQYEKLMGEKYPMHLVIKSIIHTSELYFSILTKKLQNLCSPPKYIYMHKCLQISV